MSVLLTCDEKYLKDSVAYWIALEIPQQAAVWFHVSTQVKCSTKREILGSGITLLDQLTFNQAKNLKKLPARIAYILYSRGLAFLKSRKKDNLSENSCTASKTNQAAQRVALHPLVNAG